MIKGEVKEQFTIDNGTGKGYTVYYRKKNGCYYYTVTHNDSGNLIYSKVHRIPKDKFYELKETTNEVN